MDLLKTQLSESQKRAVESDAQHLQIVGYPGSGKTLVLASRISRLVHEGIPPESIVALTLTNSACYSLRKSIRAALQDLPEQANTINILTYHSYCRLLVDSYAHDVGLTNEWTMLDYLDLHNLLFHPNLGLRRKRASGYPFVLNHKELKQSKQLFGKYKAYDFDSALEFGRLIAANRNVGVSHLILDEFQDCTTLQWEIAKAILRTNTLASIVAAGDPNQEIFTFQSDHFDQAFTRMQREFPQTKVMHLTENYRSTAGIIEAFQSVLDDTSSYKVPLRSMVSSGEEPVMIVCEDAEAEKREVSNLIKDLLEKDRYEFRDIAVLVRYNANVSDFESALDRENIPSYSLASMRTLSVKRLPNVAITLLKWAYKPRDMFLIQLLHNRLFRFISDSDMEKLHSRAQQSFSSSLSSPPLSLADQLISLDSKKYSHSFLLEWLPSVRQQLLNTKDPCGIFDIVKHTITSWKKKAGSKANFLAQDMKDWASFLRVFEKCCRNVKLSDLTLEEQCQQGATLSAVLKGLFDPSLSNAYGNNEVVVTTIHSAKSQQWPVVILPTGSLNEFTPAESYEDSSKLQYVAASRAMEKLYFTTSGNIKKHNRHALVKLRENSAEKGSITASQAIKRDYLVFNTINAVRVMKRFIKV